MSKRGERWRGFDVTTRERVVERCLIAKEGLETSEKADRQRPVCLDKANRRASKTNSQSFCDSGIYRRICR